MDFNSRQSRTKTSFTTRKLKTKLVVFKDNYLNFKSILKFTLPILIVIAVLPIGLVYLVNITYQRRTITTPQEIPLELRTGVVILKQSDILYDFDNARKLIETVKDLYTKKRVTQVLIISYNDASNIIPSIEPFQQFFKDIPTENYKIDISAKDIASACSVIEEKYQVQKFVLSSYRNLLPRVAYACSFNGLYVKPYLPRDLNIVSKEDDFNKTLEIILNSIFKD